MFEAASVIFIILIFQIIDMLSCGPLLLYSGDIQLINSIYNVEEIELLKKIGCLVYIYSNIFSMICFSIFSKINSTLVAGIIVESIRPMINSYYRNIILETSDIDGYVTNFIFHFFITALWFSFLSLFLFYTKKAHYLGLIPRCVINGCLGAVGIGQLNIALDCLIGSDNKIRNIPILFFVAFSVIALYYVLKVLFRNSVYLIPSYVISLILIFYIISSVILDDEKGMIGYLRAIEWLSSTDTVLYPSFVLKRLDPSKISYTALVKNFIGILTIVSISSIHIAVNLPVFKMATGVEFDFSTELKTQGLSNLFTFVPSYFMVSYSIAIYKAGGTKRSYSLIAGMLMILLALYGVMIKGYIPKFTLSLIPGVMFVDFMLSSFYNTLFYISVYEYLISVFVCAVIQVTNEYIYGIVLGFVVYVLVFSIFYMKTYQNRAASTVISPQAGYSIIEVNYILWFYTINYFLNEIKTIEGRNLIIDCQKCCAIDWISQDTIKKACHDFNEIIFIGYPYNFRPSGFNKYSNFHFYKNYEQYFPQGGKHSQKTSQEEFGSIISQGEYSVTGDESGIYKTIDAQSDYI